MPYRPGLYATSPRYLLNSIFSMASKNLRYRSICTSLWAIRDDPYREYNRTQDTKKLYIEQLKPENNGRGIILIPYVLHNTVADEYILLSL